MRTVQLKDEMTADSKNNQQGLADAETEVVFVVTKAFEEKTVRQKSLAVDVEGNSIKLNGESSTKSPDCEEQQRLKAEEVVTSRDNAKLLNDDDNLEVSRKL